MENLKTSRKRFPKNASSSKFPDSCRSAIHPWDKEQQRTLQQMQEMISRQIMEAAASPTSTLHYHPRITQKKHREGKQVTKENRPTTTRIRVRKPKFFRKEKNSDSR
jgi:hypothetical protein